MIRIFSRESKVIVTMRHDYPVSTYETEFQFNTPDKFYSLLMAKNLQNKFRSEIQRIRQEEYNNGWKDAKAKNRKKQFFKGIF